MDKRKGKLRVSSVHYKSKNNSRYCIAGRTLDKTEVLRTALVNAHIIDGGEMNISLLH